MNNLCSGVRNLLLLMAGGFVWLFAATAVQAQLLPIVVPTAELNIPTGVGVTNGGFESGFDGFKVTGEASISGTIGGSGLLAPRQGSSQLFLETTGTVDNYIADPFNATVSPDIVIDIFLGLRPNYIDGFVGFTDLDGESQGATEGSAARQTFEVTTASTLRFEYAFATDELDQPSDFSDTAFFALDGELTLLGNVETASDFTILPFSTGFDGVIPYRSLSVNLDPGIHTIGFGVVDVSDAVVNSALLVDNITLTPGVAPDIAAVSSADDDSLAIADDEALSEELIAEELLDELVAASVASQSSDTGGSPSDAESIIQPAPAVADATAVETESESIVEAESSLAAQTSLTSTDSFDLADVLSASVLIENEDDLEFTGDIEVPDAIDAELNVSNLLVASLDSVSPDAIVVNPEPTSLLILGVLSGFGLHLRRRPTTR